MLPAAGGMTAPVKAGGGLPPVMPACAGAGAAQPPAAPAARAPRDPPIAPGPSPAPLCLPPLARPQDSVRRAPRPSSARLLTAPSSPQEMHEANAACAMEHMEHAAREARATAANMAEAAEGAMARAQLRRVSIVNRILASQSVTYIKQGDVGGFGKHVGRHTKAHVVQSGIEAKYQSHKVRLIASTA